MVAVVLPLWVYVEVIVVSVFGRVCQHYVLSVLLQSRFLAGWSFSVRRLCLPPPSRWAGSLPANQMVPSWATDCCGLRARPARSRSAKHNTRDFYGGFLKCHTYQFCSEFLRCNRSCVFVFRVWRWTDSTTRWRDSISSQSTQFGFWRPTAMDRAPRRRPSVSPPIQMVSSTSTFLFLHCWWWSITV